MDVLQIVLSSFEYIILGYFGFESIYVFLFQA